MRSITGHLVALFIAAAPAGLAQQWEWEIGGAGGYGFPRDVTVTNASGSAKAGFKPAAAAGAIAGQNLYSRISGELRYTYRFGDLRIKGSGSEAVFSGQTHAIHYDLLFFTNGREARIRPYLAGGGGVKVFRGTGVERSFQELNTFAILTKTQEAKGLISVGAGVKVAVSPRIRLRLEFRDYISPFPTQVIAPVPGAEIKGWLHDFLPMIGITFGF